MPFDVIVCDEAHRLSNAKALTTKMVKGLRSERRVALTGTPVSNSPLDIHSIVDWLQPGYLGNFWQFKNRYSETETDFFGHEQITGYKNLDELSTRLLPVMLRHTKEEVMKDLPSITRSASKFDLSKDEKKLYASVKDAIVNDLKGMKEAGQANHLGSILVKLLRLKQTTGDARLINETVPSSKLELLKEMLKPILDSGEKAVIFSQFAEMVKLLEAELGGPEKVCMIIGEVPAEERQRRVDAFSDPADPHRIMVMSEAGSAGLNLQAACCYLFHFDLPWSLAKLIQREGRIHRIGQTKPVTVYSLIAKNTVDEYIVKVLHAKSKYSTDVLGDVDRIEIEAVSQEDIDNLLE